MGTERSFPRHSRRDFLRYGAGGTAAAATAGLVAAPAQADAAPDAPRPRHDPPSVARVVPTVCGVCFWKCGVGAEMGQDGTLLHLRGLPGHPLSRGRLCPRGVGGIGFHGDSDRLSTPKIRRGERGEGVFRDVPWDEAVAEFGSRIRPIIEKEGPGAVAFLTHGSSEAHYGHLSHAMGTPLHTHPAYDQCKGPREVGFKLTFGHELKSPEPLDLENSDCIVLIGSHLGENMHNLQVQEFVEARTRGAKIVVVDPRRSTAAERADLWLQVRPGTDVALLLAWMHVLIRDGLYDHDFVRDRCEGMGELRRHVEEATPEWAARQTSVPAEQIEAAARMIGQAAPHTCIHPGRHVVWYGDDTQRSRAIAILVALTGSWGSRGGYYLPRKAHLPEIQEAFPTVPPYPAPAERRDPGYPFSVGVNVDGIRQATRQGKVKAWIVSGTNLITTLPGRDETLDAIGKLDLLVVIDLLPTEITRHADILLPAASYLERPDPLVVTPSRDAFVAMPQKAAEPVGSSRCECEVAALLGRELGLERFWAWTSMEQFQRGIVDAHNRLHPEEEAIDWERLCRAGFVVLDEGSPIYRAGRGLGPDGSGRAGAEMVFPDFDGKVRAGKVKLYSPDLDAVCKQKIAAGEDPGGFEPLPTWYPPRGGPPGHVRLLSGRSPVHSFGRTQNTPVLHGREPENAVWASPHVAEIFGVQHGEYVDVVNADGVRQGPVRLLVTTRMGDDAVYVTHGHGRNVRQLTRAWKGGADDSALMTRYAVDPLSGGTAMRVNFVRLARRNEA